MEPDRRPYSLERLCGDVLRFDSIDSTNSELRRRAEQGAPEGTVVVADSQTAGRGRLGRTWNSPSGAGLYASILLRPALKPDRAQCITLLAAVAAAEAIDSLGVRGVSVKWPNDVLVNELKVCGVLVESGIFGDAVEWVIVGVGINLTDEAVPAERRDSATALSNAGVRASSAEVLDCFLEAIDRGYISLMSDGGVAIADRWSQLSPMSRGRLVSIDSGGESFEAVTDGLSPAGHLRVLRDGVAVEVSAGEVTLRHRGGAAVRTE